MNSMDEPFLAFMSAEERVREVRRGAVGKVRAMVSSGAYWYGRSAQRTEWHHAQVTLHWRDDDLVRSGDEGSAVTSGRSSGSVPGGSGSRSSSRLVGCRRGVGHAGACERRERPPR